MGKLFAAGLLTVCLAGPASAQTQSAMAAYAELMTSRISESHLLTLRLMNMHLSGETFIKLVLAPNGYVQSLCIAKSSGSPVVDQAAMDNVMLTDFPPFGDGMPHKPVTFVVPISFEFTGY